MELNSAVPAGALDNRGQIEVILSDFALCGSLTAHSMNATVFHSSEETNLRLIFPSTLLKVPPTNSFKVLSSHGCQDNHNGPEAVAFFSHNPAGANTYDVNLEADSGTITVQYFAGTADAIGTFDLTFAGQRLTGSFDALYCKNLVAGLGAP